MRVFALDLRARAAFLRPLLRPVLHTGLPPLTSPPNLWRVARLPIRLGRTISIRARGRRGQGHAVGPAAERLHHALEAAQARQQLRVLRLARPPRRPAGAGEDALDVGLGAVGAGPPLVALDLALAARDAGARVQLFGAAAATGGGRGHGGAVCCGGAIGGGGGRLRVGLVAGRGGGVGALGGVGGVWGGRGVGGQGRRGLWRVVGLGEGFGGEGGGEGVGGAEGRVHGGRKCRLDRSCGAYSDGARRSHRRLNALLHRRAEV